ncbi:MAG TPA: hypothetical protein PLK52_04505 [Usitatibacteraceae bacterium]|nr:hypothetical protein [Usitatibacteraceae bacterium]
MAAVVKVTTHVPVPVHPPPLQPAKVDPGEAVATSVICEPIAPAIVHDAPQSSDEAGAVATVPDPLPDFVTVSGVRKDATRVSMLELWSSSAAVTVTWQFACPVHAVPVSEDTFPPASAVAVSVTEVPGRNSASQSLSSGPQLMPGGDETTVPPPLV